MSSGAVANDSLHLKTKQDSVINIDFNRDIKRKTSW